MGISRYQSGELNLRYARRDAEELRSLLQTPEGGNFHPDRVRLLVDEAATTAGVTKALRSFLLEAMPDDLVLLYFACHGGPDQRRPSGPLYLYTHDTDPVDVAGTAVPMDDLDRSLRQIRAERVVITVDTCHSGGVGTGIRTTGRAEATNRYLDALARARGGVALLSSAEASESSEEDAKWGGGHGVFTHFLLEGMRGAADGYQGERDGIVSVGELFEYVRHHVRRATDGRQHPAIGTTAFDRGLPMAVTAELNVEQHLTIGRGLYDIGWRLDDPAPFLLAARQFAVAADLKRHLPQADADRGSALLAAGRTAEAAHVLQAVTTMYPQEVAPQAWLHLGIAKADLNEPAAAAQAFREYVRRDPADDESVWATAYADWLDGHDRPLRCHAVLVGVGHFDGPLSNLPGVANDLELMRRTMQALGADVWTMQDRDASRESVLAKLTEISAEVGRDDVVVFYFTGHSADRAGLDEPYLITGLIEGNAVGITPRELIDALDLPAREVLLILDTHVTPALMLHLVAAADERLQVLLACGVGEVAYEIRFGGLMHGAFTYHLAEVLTHDPATSYGDLVDAIRLRMTEQLGSEPTHMTQSPRLIGTRASRVLSGRFPAAELWRAARKHTYQPAEILMLRRTCTEVTAPLATWALGRALVKSGKTEEGLQRLVEARDGMRTPPAELWLDLAAAALDENNMAAAKDALEAVASADGWHEHAETALAAIAHADTHRPLAVIIGADPPDSAVGGAAVATRIARVIRQALDVAETDVRLITGPAATTERILAETAELARRSASRLVVFVLVGAASSTGAHRASDGWPEGGSSSAIHTRDGLLWLDDVFAQLKGAANVLTLLDVVLTGQSIARDLAVPPPIDLRSVWLAGTLVLIVEDAANDDRQAGPLNGNRIVDLLDGLPAARRDGRSYLDWIGGYVTDHRISLGNRSNPKLPWQYIYGPHQAALTDLSPKLTVQRCIATARTAAANAVVRLAEAEINRRAAAFQSYPEGQLQLGLALEVCARPQDARAALRTARNLYEDDATWSVEQQHDPTAAIEFRRQARYHYGRLLVADDDRLEEAVAALRDALHPEGDNPRILITLAHAIRTVVERQSLVEAGDYVIRYINGGAPLGLRAELVDFAIQRQQAAQTQ